MPCPRLGHFQGICAHGSTHILRLNLGLPACLYAAHALLLHAEGPPSPHYHVSQALMVHLRCGLRTPLTTLAAVYSLVVCTSVFDAS